MTLTEIIRNEPVYLCRFYGDFAPDVVRVSIGEMDALRRSEDYIGNANLLDRIEWLAEEISYIEDDPDAYGYDNYVALLFHLPLTSMMLTLSWLGQYYPTTHAHLLEVIRDGEDPHCQQVHQRLRRTMQQIELNKIINQDTLYLLKEAMA